MSIVINPQVKIFMADNYQDWEKRFAQNGSFTAVFKLAVDGLSDAAVAVAADSGLATY